MKVTEIVAAVTNVTGVSIDGDGFLGVCVFPALAVLLVGEFIVYPWHMELLAQAFRRMFGA